ncbi:MAG: transglycosylase SLT domain-containing protein, partial [Bdellovibrionota bacterium]|nr:transglycosylase SLT domain-containing protein [Bdellovibrionota bacterium]
MLRLGIISLFIFSSANSIAAISKSSLELDHRPIFSKHKPLALAKKEDASAFSDVPITYNREVQKWVKYFQGRGRGWFKVWLERSNRHKDLIHGKLEEAGLPKDLIYLAMIESGFSFRAVSHASAVGPWQFIAPTAKQYGLEIN